MATEIMMRRGPGGLVPIDRAGHDALDAIGKGVIVRATIRQPRNVNHHRKFFALLQVIHQHQSVYPTVDHLLDAIKIATGHFEIWRFNGREVVTPRSISFAKMDQMSFAQFYDRVVELAITKIIPGLSDEALKAEVLDLIGADFGEPVAKRREGMGNG